MSRAKTSLIYLNEDTQSLADDAAQTLMDDLTDCFANLEEMKEILQGNDPQGDELKTIDQIKSLLETLADQMGFEPDNEESAE